MRPGYQPTPTQDLPDDDRHPSSSSQYAVSPEIHDRSSRFPASPQQTLGQGLSPNSNASNSNAYSPWLVDPLSPNLHDSPAFNSKHGSHAGLMDFHNATNGPPPPAGPGLGVYRVGSNGSEKPLSWYAKIIRSKWSMVACLLLGIAGFLAHHFVYKHLDGREAQSQEWWRRLGQFISFFAKANFVVAALMAQQQVAWRAVGQKGFSVEAVDSLFGSSHNVLEMFNREAWIKSTGVMLLALYIWASPFVVIFTSATLDSVQRTTETKTTCPAVRTLNFANEDKPSWRTPLKAEGETLNGRSLSSYLETAKGGDTALTGDDEKDKDIFEYYAAASGLLTSIFNGVASSGRAIPRENAANEICGGTGWDCSVEISFLAPGYKCEELARGADDTMKNYGDQKEHPVNLTLNMDMLVPRGNYTYLANTLLGEYVNPQMANEDGGKPKDDPPYPENLGAFRTEPMLWIGYADVEDRAVPHATNDSDPRWQTDYTPVIFACEHWETKYDVLLNYTGGTQTYNITDRTYERKIIDTVYKGANGSDGTLDRTVAEPPSSFVRPKADNAYYRKIAAYHGVGQAFRALINGTTFFPGPQAVTNMGSSKLVDRHESLVVEDFQGALRKLYEDAIVSLLSDPQLMVVSWAADPSRMSGTKMGGDDTRYECVRRRTALVFSYHWQVLVGVYLASFFVALIGVVCGIWAMRKDGAENQRDTTFSSIAVATKRVDLDEKGLKDMRIRCWPVNERRGSRLFEFRAER